MANSDRPTGFRPVSTLSGASWNGAYRKFYTDTNAFMGDIMIADAVGIADGDGAYQGVTRATAGTAGNIIGVVVGWEVDPATSLEAKYHVGSATVAVYLCVDPFVIFECQSDDSDPAVLDVGNNYDFIVTAGTVATGVSNMELDGSSEVTTLGTPLRLLGIVDRPDNEAASANAKCLVMINMHTFVSNTGAAGV